MLPEIFLNMQHFAYGWSIFGINEQKQNRWSKKPTTTRADNRSQQAQHLKCKHENLSSIPRNHRMKLDVVAHTCNPSTGDRERRIPRAQWPNKLD